MEVEMFPDIYNVEGVVDAADSCDGVILDAEEYMKEIVVQ